MTLGVAGFARVLSANSRPPLWSLGAYGLFPVALGVVGWVRVRSVHSRAPLGFGCVRPISLRPGCRMVRSFRYREPWGSSIWLVCVRNIPVRPCGCRVCSCALGPLQCALGVVGFVSMHSPAPWGVVWFVPVHSRAPGVRSGTFGPFPCDPRVRSVHSRSALRLSGSFSQSLAP